jgi:hypothetical protein
MSMDFMNVSYGLHDWTMGLEQRRPKVAVAGFVVRAGDS